MSSDPFTTKAAIRDFTRQWLKTVSAEQRAQASRQACVLLEKQRIWQRARAVLFFAPLADELDLSPLWGRLAARGHRVLLPRFVRDLGLYEICELKRFEQNLQRGQFGILEPDATCPSVPLKQLDLTLVPGLAFDRYGRRLGRGKGFYDRLLNEISAIKCGVAFDEQIQFEIPVEAHDVRMDCILTPTRWLDCSQGAAVK